MRAVNLLPKNEPRKRRRHHRKGKVTPWPVVIALAGIAVASAAVGAAFLQAQGTAADRQEELAAASAELASLPKPKPVPNSDAALAAQRDQRAAAVSSAFAYHISWDRVLRRLALVLPDDVWLTRLNGQAPRAAGVIGAIPDVGTPTGFLLEGYTYSHASVARLLGRLSLLPDLTSVQLNTSAIAKIGERDVVAFTISGNVRAGGPST